MSALADEKALKRVRTSCRAGETGRIKGLNSRSCGSSGKIGYLYLIMRTGTFFCSVVRSSLPVSPGSARTIVRIVMLNRERRAKGMQPAARPGIRLGHAGSHM